MAAPAFDVFISFKSEDESHARAVYEELRAAGRRVFFSRESLPRLGSDEYHKQIDLAIEQAAHMVVVTSSAAHVQSKWVEYEWRLFLGEVLARRKSGNLITLLAGDMRIDELPISLRNREVARIGQGGLAAVIGYTRAGNEAPPPEAVPPRSPGERAFRHEATFGGPPATALVRATPAGDLIVTGGVDGALRLFNRRTRARIAMLGSRRYFLARHEALVTALAVSADGRFLASGHLDGAVHVWDVAAQREIGDLSHKMAIGGLVFSPDATTLVSGSRDGSVRYWDLASGEGPTVAGAATKMAPVVHHAWLAQSGWLVTGLVNTVTGRHFLQVEKSTRPDRVLATVSLAAPFRQIDIAANESIAAATGADGIVRVYDWRPAADQIEKKLPPKHVPLVGEFKAHSRAVAGLSVFPDGTAIATCAKDALMIWSADTLQMRTRLSAESGATFAGVVVVAGGTAIVAALADGRLQVFEAI